MSCNNKTSVAGDISSSSNVSLEIDFATPLAFEYPSYVSEALIEMNDPSVVVPSIRYGIDNLIESVNSYLYPILINSPTYETVIPVEYPSLDERTQSGKPLITYTELADFLNFTSYDKVSDFNRVIEINPRKSLTELNNYYSDQLSGSSVDLCSLLENPFAMVSGIVDKISDMDTNILNLIPGIASRLKSFAETMKQLTSNVFETMKGVIENMASQMQNFVNMPQAAFAGIASHFSQQFASLQNLLSEPNLENIKNNIEKFVTKAVKQFEKILENPQVILYLLYMFCKTSSSIESSIKKPVQSFQSMFNNTQSEYNVLKVRSAPVTKGAIEAGRPVVTDSSAESIKTARTTSHNQAVGSDLSSNTDDVPDQAKVIVTPKHTKHPPPDSWSNLAFAPSVINNPFWRRKSKHRTYDGGTIIPANTGISPAVGYWGAKLKELEMINEVGRLMGKKLTINSAFRHPYYNKHIGGARKSQHMNGVAFDVSMAGINRKVFVATAKKVGFRGIGHYRSFIHVDTGPARSW